MTLNCFNLSLVWFIVQPCCVQSSLVGLEMEDFDVSAVPYKNVGASALL